MVMIITMAGRGSRFRDVGYNVPKFMIEAKGRTLFEWSMESLMDYNDEASRYIFVTRKEDQAKAFIEKMCDKLQIRNRIVYELDATTDGQATTALLAMEYCSDEEEVMIYNIDTYVEAGELKKCDITGDGYIPCFHAPGDHWSFVKTDEQGNAIEVKEKERISDNCTLGAYYFKSAGLYRQLYKNYYSIEHKEGKKEKYIAPMYNQLIMDGKKVNISMIDYNKVHVLGTPEELQEFIEQK